MTDCAISLPTFSKNRDVLSGTLPLSDMLRLRDSLVAETASAATYTVHGDGDVAGGLFINIAVTAVLPLLCQRCLEVFDFRLNVERRFKLQTEKEERTFCEEYEILEADEIMLADFIEEEIILSLPFAPAHTLTQCSAAHYFVA